MKEGVNKKVKELEASLEELWAAVDALFEELSPTGWQQPHGPDWVFADLPYHLSYIDRLAVARPIELGEKLPLPEQVRLRSLNELNAWNQAKFAARPEGQIVEISLEQMGISRDYVRQVMADLTDTDLAKPSWFPLLNIRGFRPAQVNLAFCAGHTWQHLEEARVRRGHSGTMVSPDLTHLMLNGTIPGIPLYLIMPTTALFLDAHLAGKLDFSFAFNITGPGGGVWAFHPFDNSWQVKEVESPNTDLVLSLDLDAYIKIRYFIADLAALLEAGEIEVNDDQALALYQRLFIAPDFNFIFPKMP